jgi:hypothetical protein
MTKDMRAAAHRAEPRDTEVGNLMTERASRDVRWYITASAEELEHEQTEYTHTHRW